MTWLDDSHAVVECLETGLVHVVNNTAGKILELLEGRTPREIAEIMSKTYSIDLGTALADISETLVTYESLGLIRRHA
jgi:hypothetical protein